MKGPPAALLATAVQSNFAAHAPVAANPAETMARINHALLRRAIGARFATMFYGVLSADGRLRYCNAGQEPPLVVRAAGGVGWLEAGGPVVGLLGQATYELEDVLLQPSFSSRTACRRQTTSRPWSSAIASPRILQGTEIDSQGV